MPRTILPILACSIASFTFAACGASTTSPSRAANTPDASTQDSAPPDDQPDAADTDAGPPVDNGAPSTNYPAPHPDLPQLVNQAGGNVLATPKVHLVFYPGYDHEADMVDLAKKIGASAYWTAIAGEYGVGSVTYTGETVLTGETAPNSIADSDVETFMNGKIASGAFGTPDPSTIYTIVYPKGTTITSQSGPLGPSQSCSSFGGYHNDTPVALDGGTQNFAYAVLPTCAAFGGMSEIDGITGAASHEWVEAVTDPYPSTNNGRDSAYSSVDQDHFIWLLGGGTEAGDLCVPEANAFYKPAEVGHTVQRSWSNKSAKASHDPCVPALPGAFFDSAPVLPETVTMPLPVSFGGAITTKGVTIPMGQTKTIEVDLFSDGDTGGAWTVSAEDGLAQVTRSAPTLDFSWDRTSGVNGEKLHLTITVKGASTMIPGAHPFVVTSTLGSRRYMWPALVVEK